MVSLAAGELSAARVHLDQAVACAEAINHPPMIAASLGPLGYIAFAEGDKRSAQALLSEAANNYKQGPWREGLPLVLDSLRA